MQTLTCIRSTNNKNLQAQSTLLDTRALQTNIVSKRQEYGRCPSLLHADLWKDNALQEFLMVAKDKGNTAEQSSWQSHSRIYVCIDIFRNIMANWHKFIEIRIFCRYAKDMMIGPDIVKTRLPDCRERRSQQLTWLTLRWLVRMANWYKFIEIRCFCHYAEKWWSVPTLWRRHCPIVEDDTARH